jgi:hypothetical protein
MGQALYLNKLEVPDAWDRTVMDRKSTTQSRGSRSPRESTNREALIN